MAANSTAAADNMTRVPVNTTSTYELSRTTQQPIQLDCGLPIGQCDVLRTIQKAIQAVSISVLLLAFICIFLLRKYRLFHERIICHFLLADLLATVTVISLDGRPEVEGTAACTVQGYFFELFVFAELIWLCHLTTFIFLHVVKSIDTTRYEWIYTVTGWLIPTAIACIPLITEDYGLANAPYCWISPSPTGHIYRVLLYYAPAVLVILAMLGAFTYMFWHARKEIKQHRRPEDTFANRQKTQVQNYLKPLTAYAGAYFLLKILLLANRVQNARGVTTFGFLVFHVTVISAYGLILTILFVLTNGQKEFSKENFTRGLRYHMKLCKNGRKTAVVETNPVYSASSITGQV